MQCPLNYIAERRQEEKDRRRAQILDAAEAVAATHGIDALTMDQVARRARLSRALLYVYFKDKSDLHLGICERGLELLQQRFEQASARHATGLERIVAMGRAYVAFAAEFPVHFDAMARFQAREVSAGQATGSVGDCFQAGERVHQIMFAAIEAGHQDGSIDPAAGSPVSVAMTLWGCIHGIIQLVSTKGDILGEYGLGGRGLTDQALQLLAAGLRPGPR
jgi:TetR/AcrR family transcriptional regulator